jgi:hypothetical protein
MVTPPGVAPTAFDPSNIGLKPGLQDLAPSPRRGVEQANLNRRAEVNQQHSSSRVAIGLAPVGDHIGSKRWVLLESIHRVRTCHLGAGHNRHQKWLGQISKGQLGRSEGQSGVRKEWGVGVRTVLCRRRLQW